VKRIFIVAALAVLSFGLASVPAHAVQTAHFEIVGVGRVTAAGIDCSRLPGGQVVGDCDETIQDDAPFCDPESGICTPQGGGLTFTATPGDGFQFTSWSHPQCNPRSRNPCGVVFAPGPVAPPFDIFTITATFTDVQNPTTAVTDPGANAAVRGTIAVKANAADNAGTPGVALNAGGRILAQFTAPPFQTTFDTRTVPDGPMQFSSTATDSSNRTATSTVNVTVDNTNPTLNVTGPNNQTFGPGATPTWTLAAADQTTAVNVRCSVVPVGQPANLGNCTGGNTQERLVNPADGRYTLTVRATDAAGNFVEQARAFAVDTGPPDTTITSGPGDGSSTEATSLTWGLGASEASTFECRLYLTATGPGAFAPCSGAASHTVSGLAAGNYTFEARATDGFNNVDPTPVKRTVLVVSPPPVIPPPVVHQTTIFQQVIVVTLTFSYHADKKATRITALTVNSVPKGATVSARCPKGCAKKSLVVKNAKGNVSLKALAGKKPLKLKTKITVTVSKPGAVSAVKVLQVQKRKAPTVQSFCQPPGAAKPGRCA